MKVIDFNTKIPIELERLEDKIMSLLIGKRNDRIVKPQSFLYSQIDSKEWGYAEEWAEEIEAYDARLEVGRVLSQHESRVRYDVKFFPMVPSSQLFHQTSVIRGRKTILERLKSRSIYGNRNVAKPTYLKFKGASEVYGTGDSSVVFCEGDDKNLYFLEVLFEIDNNELLKTRNVFRDPEGIDLEEEAGDTFLVFGGIPYQSIKGVNVSISKARSDTN